jgi:hypothetical protein
MKPPCAFSRLIVLAVVVTIAFTAARTQTSFWQPTTGSGGEISQIATMADGRIYAAGTGGVYRSSDDGVTWSKIFSTGFSVALNPKTGSIFVRGGSALWRSTNDGADWSIIRNASLLESVTATADGLVLIGGTYGSGVHPAVYRSSDDGSTWKVRPLLGQASWPSTAPFAVAPGGFIFTAVYFGSITYSNPIGLSWIRLRAPQLKNVHIARIWVSASNEIFAGTYAGRIFRSSDGGHSWTVIMDRPTPLFDCWSPPLQGFTVDPGGNYYAGYLNDGVYRSTDRGRTWSLLNDGLPIALSNCGEEVYYADAFGITHDGHILVGTDQGIYRSSQAVSPAPHASYDLADLDVIPHRSSLAQNYPNPFNPTTNIEFVLSTDALVTISVYNTLGQEVASLCRREELGAGTNEFEFDGSRLSSGVYYYRLIAQDVGTGEVTFTSTKKMALVK